MSNNIRSTRLSPAFALRTENPGRTMRGQELSFEPCSTARTPNVLAVLEVSRSIHWIKNFLSCIVKVRLRLSRHGLKVAPGIVNPDVESSLQNSALLLKTVAEEVARE